MCEFAPLYALFISTLIKILEKLLQIKARMQNQLSKQFKVCHFRRFLRIRSDKVYIPNCPPPPPFPHLEEQEQAECIGESLEAEQIDEDHGRQTDVRGDREAECASTWRDNSFITINYRLIVAYSINREETFCHEMDFRK